MRERFQPKRNGAGSVGVVGPVWIFLLIGGCESSVEGILDDDPPAVIALKNAGAIIERQPSMVAPGMIGRTVDLSNTSSAGELLVHLPDVPGLLSVKLSGSNVTNEVLAKLPELRSVTELDLSQSSVSDEGLKYLKALPSLATLNLSDTQIKGHGLTDLPSSVGGLVLANLPIGDKDLENLEALKRLRMLVLTGTNVTAAGVAHVKQGRPRLLTVGIKLN
jgi:hypothetical protein